MKYSRTINKSKVRFDGLVHRSRGKITATYIDGKPTVYMLVLRCNPTLTVFFSKEDAEVNHRLVPTCLGCIA